MNKKLLEQFGNFNYFVESIDDVTWQKLISPGKWTVKEVVAHLWNWDTYTLNTMLPHIKDQVKLPEFVDHDTHNLKAIEKAKEFKERESIIKTFIETRTHLVNQFHKVAHSEIRFFIGNDKRPYTYERYLKIFVHHDEHHKKQIENLLR
ncbi:DinB family protein [Paenibacillus tundrae]|uniref:Damage-inducible protein DinB n=1 Tax=Paenibacillus tundrae TaxID=528187 RepID=A0ABT9WA07_9BACL|nr:DinB family protein [Paenibacillus tundrae]MDQ0170081.1 putative damage-inducible protein DinB [Paenibacillus tundrae]